MRGPCNPPRILLSQQSPPLSTWEGPNTVPSRFHPRWRLSPNTLPAARKRCPHFPAPKGTLSRIPPGCRQFPPVRAAPPLPRTFQSRSSSYQLQPRSRPRAQPRHQRSPSHNTLASFPEFPHPALPGIQLLHHRKAPLPWKARQSSRISSPRQKSSPWLRLHTPARPFQPRPAQPRTRLPPASQAPLPQSRLRAHSSDSRFRGGLQLSRHIPAFFSPPRRASYRFQPIRPLQRVRPLCFPRIPRFPLPSTIRHRPLPAPSAPQRQSPQQLPRARFRNLPRFRLPVHPPALQPHLPYSQRRSNRRL